MKKPMMMTAIASMTIGLTAIGYQAVAQSLAAPSGGTGNRPMRLVSSPSSLSFERLGIRGKQLEQFNALDAQIKARFVQTYGPGVHMTAKQTEAQDSINEDWKAGLKRILSPAQYRSLFAAMMAPIARSGKSRQPWMGAGEPILDACEVTQVQYNQLDSNKEEETAEMDRLRQFHREQNTREAFKLAHEINRKARLRVALVLTHFQHMTHSWKWYRQMEPAMAAPGRGDTVLMSTGGTLKALEKHPPVLP